jgi:D-alanine-D-alanine ligase
MNGTTFDPANTRVLLLVGGTSNEREISLASGASVEAGLKEAGFPVEVIDTGKEGYLSRVVASGCDVVFICLHGKEGEDGTMQGLCELMGKPYVGPGVLASALALDKSRAKTFYIASGLPTPNSFSVRRGEPYNVDEILAAAGEKCVVKPYTEGSAIGVTIVHNPQELDAAIEKALAIDDVALVERFVEGVEVTVAVLGNDDPVALPVIEIIPRNEFYDYESKYDEGGSEHICPAHIPEEQAEACKRISITAHQALGCKGVSRSDFIIDATGTPWILETNTIPGMTETSLLPDAARAVGIEFPELCRRLIELALER